MATQPTYPVTFRDIKLSPELEAMMEDYTPERIAEFLLNNAIGQEDYAQVCDEVRRMGLDPKKILHDPLPGVPGSGSSLVCV